ncbi:MAG: hypothetical protein IKQ23_12855 [Treponema sp.]|nr:hypothetical protein [Treponema sp.]
MSRETFTKRNQRIITRPRLAAYLLELGYDVQLVPNPFSPQLHAWAVEDTPETRKLIDGFLAALRAERENSV